MIPSAAELLAASCDEMWEAPTRLAGINACAYALQSIAQSLIDLVASGGLSSEPAGSHRSAGPTAVSAPVGGGRE